MKTVVLLLAACVSWGCAGGVPCLAGQNSRAAIDLWEAGVSGDTLSYRVAVSSAVKTRGVLVRFQIPTDRMQVLSWEEGNFVDAPLSFGPYLNEARSTVLVAIVTTNEQPMTTASGEVGTIRFLRTAPGEISVSLIEATLCDEHFALDEIIDETHGQVHYARRADERIPVRYALGSASPNPALGNTLIHYEVPRPGAEVRIAIYDVQGRVIRTVIDGHRSPGYYSELWDLRNNGNQRVAPGIYFCRMEAGSFKDTKKLVLLK